MSTRIGGPRGTRHESILENVRRATMGEVSTQAPVTGMADGTAHSTPFKKPKTWQKAQEDGLVGASAAIPTERVAPLSNRRAKKSGAPSVAEPKAGIRDDHVTSVTPSPSNTCSRPRTRPQLVKATRDYRALVSEGRTAAADENVRLL